MSYDIKNARTHKGHEGEPVLQCSLYRDGRKVATYRGDDCGGESRFLWLDWKAPRAEVLALDCGTRRVYMGTPEEALLWRHLQSLPDIETPYGTMTVTPDVFVEELNETRKLRRLCRNRTLFRLAGDESGVWRTIAVKYSAGVRQRIQVKYGDQVLEIMNETEPGPATAKGGLIVPRLQAEYESLKANPQHGGRQT